MEKRPGLISIVTPSLNMLEYLKRCVSSVRDQEAAAFEHIVMDGGSIDGTIEWGSEQPGLKMISEIDEGMYDAINKGFVRSSGEVLAFLNCDEQYLPGTLEFVAEFFAAQPDIDVLFGDALLIRPDGSHFAYRKTIPPRLSYILASHLYLSSCAMFFRAKVLTAGHCFDVRYRTISDMVFVVDLLRRGHKCAHVRRYLAAFTMTGANLGLTEVAKRELESYSRTSPRWVRLFRPLLNAGRFAEKALRGCYFENKPLSYSVYVSGECEKRIDVSTMHPTFRWKQYHR